MWGWGDVCGGGDVCGCYKDPSGDGAAGVANSAVPSDQLGTAAGRAGVTNSAIPSSTTRDTTMPARTGNLVIPRRPTVRPQAGPPATDEELAETGEDPTMGDKKLLTRVVGRQPTRLRLHAIRDSWDARILQEVRKTDEEAEQLKTQATQFPPATKAWRLLREEAKRLEQHGVLTRMWIGNRAEPPGLYIHPSQDNIPHGQ